MEHWQRMQTLASVTSYAEVWIEISHYIISHPAEIVTSYAEVWIEIASNAFNGIRSMSPPTRRCGLK